MKLATRIKKNHAPNKETANMQTTATQPTSSATAKTDPRPRFGIGHVSFTATNVAELAKFYGRVGMRVVVESDRFAILELRGGTHLVLHSGPAGGTELDLIVDDIDETLAAFNAEGVETSSITRGNPHDRFLALDPEGNRLQINSNHAMGPV